MDNILTREQASELHEKRELEWFLDYKNGDYSYTQKNGEWFCEKMKVKND